MCFQFECVCWYEWTCLVLFCVKFYVGIMAENMDLFSLEDDDCSQLFITQEPKQNIENMDINDGMFLGIAKTDFSSPCASLVSKDSIYSDISNAEDVSNWSQTNNIGYVRLLTNIFIVITCVCYSFYHC